MPPVSVSVPSVGAPRTTAEAADVHPFAWTGSPWSLAPICLLNAALGLLTIGVYTFWGRTELRRRMWSSVRFLGEPFTYHGTGRELMIGFLSVLAALLVPLFVIGTAIVVVFGQTSGTYAVYQLILFAVIYPVLAAVAYYRARRYRLSRTAWRGIRGSMTGSSGAYGFFSWATMLAYPFTLGWIAPYRAVALQRRLATETALGSEDLRFDGAAWPLYGRFALLWFGSIVLYLGVLGAMGEVIGYRANDPFWYQQIKSRDIAKAVGIGLGALFIWSILSSFYYARLYNHVAASTTLGRDGAAGFPAHRFRLEVKGRELIWLFVTNAMITYLTLYVLKPVATARSLKYYSERLALVGAFPAERLGQNLQALDRSGEGLGQAFDLDAF